MAVHMAVASFPKVINRKIAGKAGRSLECRAYMEKWIVFQCNGTGKSRGRLAKKKGFV